MAGMRFSVRALFVLTTLVALWVWLATFSVLAALTFLMPAMSIILTAIMELLDRVAKRG
jgi:hypothetical protein